MNRLTKSIVGIAVLVAVGAAALFVRDVFRTGDAAERQLMAMNYVQAACSDYIAVHHDWPRSWEDLEKARPHVGQVTLPRDRQWVEQQVVIDFHANLKDLAEQTTETFTGFRPQEVPYYGYLYDGVIEAARKALRNATSMPGTAAN